MQREKGQILPMVLIVLAVLTIMVPAMVLWVQSESRATVKSRKMTTAFNLAEAAVDRGLWELKKSTTTWNTVYSGTPITGYNFDVSYDDIAGGTYRIRYGNLTGNQVEIIGEGRDSTTDEVRAIRAVYRNMSVPGVIISGGMVNIANAFEAHWGPIMAHDNINITDASAAQNYFPRKYSRQVVTCNSKGYQRDGNGLDPPNTDGIEWWSGYDVPDLPMLDFATLRSSAAATNTLNVYGCTNKASPWGCTWSTIKCNSYGNNHAEHFLNTWNHPSSQKNYVWYWDGDVELVGPGGSGGSGIYGNVIVRGDLTLNSGDNLSVPNYPVPGSAWQEYAKITKTVGDTATKNQYPADDGYQTIRPTFNLGSESWSTGPSNANTDVGIRGFIYVGGDLDINSMMDIAGAVWVVGNISKNVGSDICYLFFDEGINLPTLNVVCVRQSWDEVTPSSTPWP
ncbi:hypothetical protein ACFL58_03885 [Elusimicrobiota bacterium]